MIDLILKLLFPNYFEYQEQMNNKLKQYKAETTAFEGEKVSKKGK